MDEKRFLRRQTQQKLSTLSVLNKQAYELTLHQQLLDSDLWKNSTTIGVTYSQEMEWDTKRIISCGLHQGKKIAIPKCNPKNHTLQFYSISEDEHDLTEGYAGIIEPNPKHTEYIESNAIELLIVPGIVFDAQGYRIGYGGGFYDRFLVGFKGKTLSLAAEFQLIHRIPREKFDLPVQHIMTEKRVLSHL